MSARGLVGSLCTSEIEEMYRIILFSVWVEVELSDKEQEIP